MIVSVALRVPQDVVDLPPLDEAHGTIPRAKRSVAIATETTTGTAAEIGTGLAAQMHGKLYQYTMASAPTNLEQGS